MAITTYHLNVLCKFEGVEDYLCILNKDYGVRQKLIAELSQFMKMWDLAEVNHIKADTPELEKEFKKNWSTFVSKVKAPQSVDKPEVAQYVPYAAPAYLIEVVSELSEEIFEETTHPVGKQKSENAPKPKKPSKGFLEMLTPDLRGKVLHQLQNKMNTSSYDSEGKGAFKVKVKYEKNMRVHLKKSKVNGIIIDVLYERDKDNPNSAKYLPARGFPYIFVKWDAKPPKNLQKDYYDPFDLNVEVTLHKEQVQVKNKKKEVHNQYKEILEGNSKA